MKKRFALLILAFTISVTANAQKAAKAFYAELGGPGLASANFDMRFAKKEDGFGFRVGIGGFSLSDGFGDRTGILTVPVGVNYLIGKDQKNYFELGAGFTYINATSSSSGFSSDNFSSSFGNLTLGYRIAPAKGGFFFKAEITPVFGNGFFIPYYGGVAFGYKF
ncbi:MAG: hypothetical protein JWN83_2238 [Chitinophagaceae bacterium]|nr:hypothetical protein [Chitinophagaceae bacterium]